MEGTLQPRKEKLYFSGEISGSQLDVGIYCFVNITTLSVVWSSQTQSQDN